MAKGIEIKEVDDTNEIVDLDEDDVVKKPLPRSSKQLAIEWLNDQGSEHEQGSEHDSEHEQFVQGIEDEQIEQGSEDEEGRAGRRRKEK
ncbi:hypothetical protein CTI12_AA357170 [Artemisia annua]|uniref:Uncharacterized protein n=1 Tax=Artemisia annua TaxID=35608 RepID=A0A2U1MPG6_ARTAN|nr:hypothetical protein CTI12_AA357170 [Artemisia annua]